VIAQAVADHFRQTEQRYTTDRPRPIASSDDVFAKDMFIANLLAREMSGTIISLPLCNQGIGGWRCGPTLTMAEMVVTLVVGVLAARQKYGYDC
jgi:hypothetical protein